MFWKILVQIAWTAARGILMASMVVYAAVAQPRAGASAGVTMPAALTASSAVMPVGFDAAQAVEPAAEPVVLEALTIFPPALPGGVQGVDYAQNILISGGTPPYGVTSTLNPAATGLTFAGSGGSYTVSGVPMLAGDTVFEVTASDSSSPVQTVVQQYIIEVRNDSAAPVISVTVFGNYGKDPWYSSDVTVHWEIVDDKPLTPANPCPDETFTTEGPHTATCTATSLDGSSTVSVPVNIDKTRPVVSGATPLRSPDPNGFYTAPISFTVTGTDSYSGIDTCPDATYAGPDSLNGYVSAYCYDNAGNESLPFSIGPIQYDTGTPVPVITYNLERQPDKNGWYNHPVNLGWKIGDGNSSIPFDSCIVSYTTQETGVAVEVPMQSMLSYAGPDTRAVTLVGKCQDALGRWGESTPLSLKYDATAPVEVTGAPVRPADHNGWYNAPVNVQFSGTDDISGIDTCTVTLYDGPDGRGISTPGSCTDRAGNTSRTVDSAAFDYDNTAPAGVSGAPLRPPDQNGRYTNPVDIQFTGTDVTSGIDTCALVHYPGPDGVGVTVPGACTDQAGNISPLVDSAAFDYHSSVLTGIVGTPVRPPDHNGWYNAPVDIQFSSTDPNANIGSCTLVHYDGPDGTGITVLGTCTDAYGSTSAPVASAAFDYDNTDPVDVSGAPVRPAEHNAWYNQPVDVAFTGTDATSGIDTCSLVHYAGPDGKGVAASGFCEDVAGNTSTPVRSAAFDYDNTDPLIKAALDGDGPVYLRQPVHATWDATDATSGVDWSVSACTQPDTSQVGPHSLACQVWDNAGTGPATASLGFSVIYRFEGFFRPVSEGWNEENAGRALPIKWHLADYFGADVNGAAVSMAVTPVSCAVDGLQPYAGTTNIEGDLQPQQHGDYHYNWKTEKEATGCAQVTIDLQEGRGAEHRFNVMWK